MRPLTAAVVGALAGAVAATIVVTLRSTPPSTPDEATARALAALEERVDRLERTAAQRPRATPAPAAEPAASAPQAVVPESSGRGRPDAPTPAETIADLSKVPSADLALESDERWARDFDIAGAVKRYRELLSRGGTPSERRHWFIRLGDCYVRLQNDAEAVKAYRECIDASTEDHDERIACMIALARRARSTNPAEARQWIDRALELGQGRSNRTVHELAVFLARDANQSDVEARELAWLVEHFPDEANAGAGWNERISQLRGEMR